MPNKLKVEYISIDDIKTYENNAKLHPAEQIEQIKKSIQEFGFNDPIAIDENNVIIEGHGRYIACNELGIKEVPIIRLEGLDEEHKKAYMLVHNKLTMNSDFDIELLSYELEDISIDMSDYGFDMEIEEEEQEIEEVETPEPPKEPKSKLGDIYQLGNHRLMCGDSTDEQQVSDLLGGVKCDLLFTDPPYNVNITEKKKKKILHCNEYNELANDNMSQDNFLEFLGKVFENANNSLKDDASYYVFSCQGGDNELMMMMMMRERGIKCRHQIIWVKDAPVFSMGRLDYDYKHEPILYGWKEKHNFYRKGEQDKSVWEYKRTENKLHPTMKPIKLICNALLNSTKENDNVLDLFGGSGSTLIACEQLNRKCYMMELDPHYVDVIIQRWENYTGKKAVKIC